MRNVTQFFRDSDETRVGIFGPDSTHLAFFVMWRPFLWLFGHVENFSTRPIALASFVARRKKRGLSGHIEKFSTCRIHLALFVAWQKVRGVSVAVRPVNHCTLARRHRYQPSAKTPVPKTRETLDARHKRSHPISALLLCNTDIRARCDLDAILMRSWCDLDAILMRSWCDLDAILMRSWCDLDAMKNIILRVYQKLKSHKNTCFRRKIACSLRKKHPFGWKTSFWRCIRS